MNKAILSILLFMVSLCVFCKEMQGAVNNEMHFRLYASDETLDPDLRLAYIDSLIEVVPSGIDSLLLLSANIAYDTGRYKRAQTATRTLLNRHKGNKTLPINRYCDAMFLLLKANFKCNDYADAFETGMTLLNAKKPDSLLYHDVECLHILHDYTSSFPDSLKNSLSVESFLAKSEKIIKEATARKVNPSVISKMKQSVIFSKMINAMDKEQYNEALHLGAEMLTYPVNKVERLALEGNMAMIYHLLGDFDKAETHYQQTLQSPGWHQNHAICLENYMALLITTGRPEKAIELMDAHPELIPIVKGNLEHVALLRRRAAALEACGRTEEGCDVYADAFYLNDSIQKSINRDYTTKLIQKFEETQTLHTVRRQYERYLTIIICLIILSSLLLVATIYLIFKKGRIAPAEERKAMTPPSETGKLAVRTLQLASMNEIFSDIGKITGDEERSEKEKLDKINILLKEVSSYGDLWHSFQILFEDLHPKLFAILKEKYPDLTQGEIRMCAYVLLNLSNKEIASLTRRNVRSVETMRYRLSKKMNLAEGETLSMRLNSLSASCLKEKSNIES